MNSETLEARKREMRRAATARRLAVDPGPARAAADAVAQHIAALAEVAAADAVALYAPRPGAGELDSRPLFEAVRRLGKPRFLPRCTDFGTLEYVTVEDWETLRPGRYGIPEPEGAGESTPGPGVVVVCPGVAFDDSGSRLGMGRGYVDRTFGVEAGARPFLVGAGYACQIMNEVPRQEHDQRMDAVVTEAGTIRPPTGKPDHG